jgi:putative oxidoreductase
MGRHEFTSERKDNMSDSSRSIVPLFGRLLVSSVFLFSGLAKIMAFSMMTGYASAKHMPFPALMIAGAATIELLGGLAVLAGLQIRLAAWILFLYLIPTTIIFHNFWTFQGADRADSQAHFLKNLAIMGGLLFLATFGPGAYSIDRRSAATA